MATESCRECICQWFRRFFDRDWVQIIFWTIFLIFSILSLLLVFFWFEGSHKPTFIKHALKTFYNHPEIILTALIAIIAWVQLKGLYKNSKADMLLRITELIRSKDILKARGYLRKIQFEVEKKIRKAIKPLVYKNTTSFRKEHNEKITSEIAEKVKKILIKDDDDRALSLFNFLNILEDICYICNKKYISLEDIQELLEHVIPRHFKIFKPFIFDSRKLYSNTAYCEFEKLYDRIPRS